MIEPKEKHGLVVRSDSLYCPIPLSIESYFWCEADCYHCYFRGLNHIWGKELRPINLEALEKKLRAGLLNENPKTSLAYCLSNKNTIRIGNKADGFQDAEREHGCSIGAMRVLRKMYWTYVVQTRFTANLMELAGSEIEQANKLHLITLLPVISPGMELDWEIFERKRTTPIPVRLKNIKHWIRKGIPLGVQGEPFIPGFHTLQDFEYMLYRLKEIGVNRYNTYNFHFTPFVAKRIYTLPGVDIERIWFENQDIQWRKILPKLIDIAKRCNMILGCPDFVNSGWEYEQGCNTCCGIDVPRPTTFNTHCFKQCLQKGIPLEKIEELTWDGSGNLEEGRAIIQGTSKKNFTLKDIIK